MSDHDGHTINLGPSRVVDTPTGTSHLRDVAFAAARSSLLADGFAVAPDAVHNTLDAAHDATAAHSDPAPCPHAAGDTPWCAVAGAAGEGHVAARHELARERSLHASTHDEVDALRSTIQRSDVARERARQRHADRVQGLLAERDTAIARVAQLEAEAAAQQRQTCRLAAGHDEEATHG